MKWTNKNFFLQILKVSRKLFNTVRSLLREANVMFNKSDNEDV
jgi:hypothetical protein